MGRFPFEVGEFIYRALDQNYSGKQGCTLYF